jgi:hypothetical protein
VAAARGVVAKVDHWVRLLGAQDGLDDAVGTLVELLIERGCVIEVAVVGDDDFGSGAAEDDEIAQYVV